ncbi:MAG TPA: YIP1 family protein [Candidatus Norongarragalinales archaeon]|jgi:hypothetical protein|nr:YIP1 family protein [Candidatus Norongarragalinales archaeon]
MYQQWIDVLTKPSQTLARAHHGKTTVEAALKQWGAAYLVAGIIAGLLAGTFLNPVAGVSALVTVLIGGLILAFLGSIIVYIFAKAMGGRGDFMTQFYLVGLAVAPIIILKSVVLLIPIIGILLNVLLVLYELVLLTIAIKEAHRLDTAKAFLSWFLPLIIVGVIVVLVAATVFIAALTGAIFGGAAGGLAGWLTNVIPS